MVSGDVRRVLTVPPAVRRILATTVSVALLIAPFVVAYAGWKVAAVFLAASGWTLLNLVLWSFFMVLILRPQADKVSGQGAMVGLLMGAKLLLLAAGLGALIAAAPLAPGQGIALLAGLFLTLTIIFLMMLGAYMTGRDFADGKKIQKRVPMATDGAVDSSSAEGRA